MQIKEDNINTTNQSLGRKLVDFVPLAGVLAYPFLLDAFYYFAGAGPSLAKPVAATIALTASFLVPLIGLLFAWKISASTAMRRLAYATVMAPSLYVFIGVLTYMAGGKIHDFAVWSVIWGFLAVAAWVDSGSQPCPAVNSNRTITTWRVIHGISAATIALFILFHIGNHVTAIFGNATHDQIRIAGETVYRNSWVEGPMVIIFLFALVVGLRLGWNWSGTRTDFYRTFQIASGVFLLVFAIGHMNSVFNFARTFLGVETTWAWAAGDEAGLVHDAWNVRLIPHYALGVFFALTHLASGLRGVLLSHGASPRRVNIWWWVGMALTLIITVEIMLGMVGFRIGG